MLRFEKSDKQNEARLFLQVCEYVFLNAYILPRDTSFQRMAIHISSLTRGTRHCGSALAEHDPMVLKKL